MVGGGDWSAGGEPSRYQVRPLAVGDTWSVQSLPGPSDLPRLARPGCDLHPPSCYGRPPFAVAPALEEVPAGRAGLERQVRQVK